MPRGGAGNHQAEIFTGTSPAGAAEQILPTGTLGHRPRCLVRNSGHMVATSSGYGKHGARTRSILHDDI